MDKQIKILIVDDEQEIRSMYAEIFKKEGFEVEEAVDGLDGLDKATKNVPDIIFTGIIMPRMDGFSLKEELKKKVATANVPVVMSSHMGRKEDEQKARESGVRDFFVVGMITPKQVVERVRAIFKEKTYMLKFDPTELDAPKLASNFNIDSKNYSCNRCGGVLALSLEILDPSDHEFKAKFVCPTCK